MRMHPTMTALGPKTPLPTTSQKLQYAFFSLLRMFINAPYYIVLQVKQTTTLFTETTINIQIINQ